MKKLIYIATIALGVVATSCADSFLEVLPNDTIDSEIVNEIMSKDVEQLQSYITAGYDETYGGNNSATNYDELGYITEMLVTEHMAGDVGFPTNSNWYAYDYQNDNRMSEWRRTRSLWTPMYYTITNCCNPVIETLGGLESLTDETKTILYQAYALRAFSYFRLINLYQQPYQVDKDALGVPLYVEDATKNIPGRATVAQIYEQIISDLDKAYEMAKGMGYKKGKAALSEYSIALIYANVLLFTGDYANAAKYAEEAAKGGALLSGDAIVQNGFNSLDMSEVLWGYDVNVETSWYYYCFVAYIDQYCDGWAPMGFNRFIDEKLYNKIGEKDIRKNWFGQGLTFINKDLTPEYAMSASPELIAKGLTKYLPNKFIDAVHTNPGAPFEADVIYFRVAEAYLVAAEAHYLNKDEANAKKWLNDLIKTRIEGYNCNLSGEALYEEICVQKRIELWGEGKRLFDVKRRNEHVERVGATHPADLRNATFNGQDAIMVYQLPKSELDNNEFITPDQQNP